MKIKSLLAFMLMSAVCVSSAEAKKKEIPVEVQAVVKSIAVSKDFAAEITSMGSQGGDVVTVEDGCFIEIRGERFRLRTPILSMEGTMLDYKTSVNKKGVTLIEFGFSYKNLYYTYEFEVKPDGQVEVYLRSNFNELNQRTELWFYGSLFMPEIVKE